MMLNFIDIEHVKYVDFKLKNGSDYMKKVLFNLFYFLYFILIFVGLGIHFWTMGIIGQMYGFFGAIIAFFVPIGSQIYLVFASASWAGTFLTQYNVIIFSYCITYVIIMVALAFTGDD